LDSVQMRDECIAIFGVTPTVQKNGFDTELALIASRSDNCREAVLSVRGLAPNYRLENLIIARDCSRLQPRIDFVFPFSDVPCELRIRAAARASDRFLGKLSKAELYEKLSTCLLAVSLPQIDSSPRTVYEAVFCGAAVAVGKSAYLEELPECMRQRIFVVASVDEPWLDEAMAFAKRVTAHRYVPSTVALEMCNERLLTEKLLEKVYGFV